MSFIHISLYLFIHFVFLFIRFIIQSTTIYPTGITESKESIMTKYTHQNHINEDRVGK